MVRIVTVRALEHLFGIRVDAWRMPASILANAFTQFLQAERRTYSWAKRNIVIGQSEINSIFAH